MQGSGVRIQKSRTRDSGFRGEKLPFLFLNPES
jgi:hypothetical protein